MSRMRTGGGCRGAGRVEPDRRLKGWAAWERSSKTLSGMARLIDVRSFRELRPKPYERGGPPAARGTLPSQPAFRHWAPSSQAATPDRSRPGAGTAAPPRRQAHRGQRLGRQGIGYFARSLSLAHFAVLFGSILYTAFSLPSP